MRQVAKQMTADFAACVENRLAVLPESEPEPETETVPLSDAVRPAPRAATPSPPIDVVATVFPIKNTFWMVVFGLSGFIIGYIVGSHSRRR